MMMMMSKRQAFWVEMNDIVLEDAWCAWNAWEEQDAYFIYAKFNTKSG